MTAREPGLRPSQSVGCKKLSTAKGCICIGTVHTTTPCTPFRRDYGRGTDRLGGDTCCFAIGPSYRRCGIITNDPGSNGGTSIAARRVITFFILFFQWEQTLMRLAHRKKWLLRQGGSVENSSFGEEDIWRTKRGSPLPALSTTNSHSRSGDEEFLHFSITLRRTISSEEIISSRGQSWMAQLVTKFYIPTGTRL